MGVLTLGSGFICVLTLAFSFGVVIPVSGAIGGLCDFMAIGSGVFFVALLEDK